MAVCDDRQERLSAAQDSPKQVLGQIHLQPRQLTIADVPGLGAPLA
jgi:hypothetical protein